jgi:hypothetical protein
LSGIRLEKHSRCSEVFDFWRNTRIVGVVEGLAFELWTLFEKYVMVFEKYVMG